MAALSSGEGARGQGGAVPQLPQDRRIEGGFKGQAVSWKIVDAAPSEVLPAG